MKKINVSQSSDINKQTPASTHLLGSLSSLSIYMLDWNTKVGPLILVV